MPYARTPSGPNRSNNGKAIAESHLPSLLSASSAFRTLTPPLGLGGRPARNFLDSLRRGRRITPARSNRASRPSGACSSRANTDSRRATGRSRSRIRTVSPCRTASIQCAQVVLRLGYSDSLHAAIIVRRHVGRRRVSGYCGGGPLPAPDSCGPRGGPDVSGIPEAPRHDMPGERARRSWRRRRPIGTVVDALIESNLRPIMGGYVRKHIQEHRRRTLERGWVHYRTGLHRADLVVAIPQVS